MPRLISLAGGLAALAFCLVLPAAASADVATPAVKAGYAVTGGFNSVAPNYTTIGYGFYTQTGIAVTRLGTVDFGNDGLPEATAVGLWDDAGNLLKSATVPAGTGATLDGGFRYVEIDPVGLAADAVYWVGALVKAEPYVTDPALTVPPELIVLNGGTVTYFANGPELTFPKAQTQNNFLAAANFGFVVPEPATLGLLALAGPLLRRRRH